MDVIVVSGKIAPVRYQVSRRAVLLKEHISWGTVAVAYSLFFVIAASDLSIVDGHDSLEDARACMELMKYRFTEDKKKDSRPNHVTKMSSASFYTSKH